MTLGQNNQSMAMKPLILILTVTFLALQYKLWFGEAGVPNVLSLKNKLDRQLVRNEQSYQANSALETKIKQLKQGSEALEERARGELGMVGVGEEYYHIID